MKKLCFFVLLVFTWLSLSGQDDPGKFGMKTDDTAVLGGLQLGAKAPDITATIDGEAFVLSEALQEGKVLLIFYRGYWCSVCNRYLSEFEEDLSKLTERGIRVIAISPEKSDFVDQTVEQTGTSVDVISDEDARIMKDYRVYYEVTDAYIGRLNNYIKRDLAEVNGQDAAALPVPATYLIGQDRTIEFVHYDINYRNRATVADILTALDTQ